MERKKASEYPQELLDLFDLYVHGELDRRGFLERAKKFATGSCHGNGVMGESAPELRLGGTGSQR